MVDNVQPVVAGKRLTPVVERRKSRRDIAAFVGQCVTHFEGTLPHYGSLHKACTCQITQRRAEHLLRYTWNLATELSKATRAGSDRRQNDGAPASAERGQGHIHTTHVEPVSHALISSSGVGTNQLVSSCEITFVRKAAHE
jgi:hypothetical protein